MTKHIVLCADDYGQAPAISQGIVVLINMGRLSAVSCLVTSPYWAEHSQWLLPFRPHVDVGLHINLTEGKPLSKPFIRAYGNQFPKLSTLMRRVFLGQVDQSTLEAEIEAQLNAFVDAMGSLPDFVDGHQHVHQFPVVRQALINVYERRLRDARVYVRLVNPPTKWSDWLFDTKKKIIMATGTQALERLLKKRHIPYNQSFSGIYEFDDPSGYRPLFKQFLQEVGEKGIIMCHPAFLRRPETVKEEAALTSDPIAEARLLEYQYLTGDSFLEDCWGVRISRWR